MEENPNEISILDILELAHSLRQEKLSIETEMNDYFRLQVKLNENSFEAIKIAWISSLHRQNLNSLILSKPENRPSLCCQRATLLESVEFIEAHKDPAVKYQVLSQYVDFLRFIHQSPHLLAHCLAAADDLLMIGSSPASAKAEQMHQIAQILSAGLYGNSIHGKDVEMMLKLLEKLLELKVATCDVPRRLLRLSSSSFAKLYHKFHESSLSSKLFLTAALHEPVMSVLIDDNIMLDIDQVDGVLNRKETIEALFQLSNKFINSLSSNWIIFPSTIRWLVQTMSRFLQENACDPKILNEILIDMVFGHFICPACVSPDLYGITDAPISENARYNLIQIGQILQMLALVRHQDIDSKFVELFRMFDENVVSNLMDQLLENTYDISEMGLSHQLPTLYNIGRSSILMTHSEVSLLVQFMRASMNSQATDNEDTKKLKMILDNLPPLVEPPAPAARQQNGTAEISPSKRTTKSMMQNLGKSSKSKMAKNLSASSLNSEDVGASCNGAGFNDESLDRVLIIPLSIYESNSKVRPLSEDEVLNMNQVTCSDRTDTAGSLTEKNVEELSRRNDESELSNIEANKEQHTRFSINQDDVSIGNTSDNLELEAVSEAPSNHSVASSLDLEENNDNDNLSDMVSANVSGRGTPNISGRDTPSSQVEVGGEVPQIPTPQMAKILNKARNDIEDKFCKFEIKKLLEGDETISIISDTWSTDVLASDSETIEASERNFSTPLIPSSIILPDTFHLRSHNFDMSETQSESAWSTDVLIASDSEKNTEMDNDDTQSITTRSDITETTPRDQEVPSVNQTPESPFFVSPRVPNIHFRPIDPSSITPRTPESPFSFRSSDDSPRLLENSGRFSDFMRPRPQPHPRDFNVPTRSNNQSNFSFAFNYLATPPTTVHPRPLRQHSNESQSSTGFEERVDLKHKSPSRDKRPAKDQQQPLSVFRSTDVKLESFDGDASGKVIKTSMNLINPFATNMMKGAGQENTAKPLIEDLDQVEHRRLSDEQRSVSYDSRRNGMIDLLSSPIVLSSSNPFDAPLTDDVKKQQQQIMKANSIDVDGDLSAKAENLKLNESTQSTSSGAIAKVANGSVKNGKPTGAIPKSISFDSTADKAEKNHNRRSELGKQQHNNSTGFLSKLRQGLKNRRGKGRHSVDDALTNDLLLNGSPLRSLNLGNGIGFLDNQPVESSDDILAKYRRKPSSSSDAATSDSTGSNNSSSLKSKSSDNENR